MYIPKKMVDRDLSGFKNLTGLKQIVTQFQKKENKK
jgi:hypothetical protein